jgi:hypothetical protein
MAQRAEKRYGREGNRWVNQTPSGDDVAAWFKENVPIDEALDHEHYVGGVTLIPNTERSKAVVGWQGTSPVIEEVFDLVLTPYMRVETRVKYFHDLMEAKGWVGFIEPVQPEKQDPRLPPGLFGTATMTADKKETRFVGCAMKVTVYEKRGLTLERVTIDKRTGEEAFRRKGKIVIDAAPATKVVTTLTTRGNVDVNALMKAETGAVGRALGMAGMLVIPGTGIATAEDLQEETGSTSVPEGAAALPPDFEPASELDGDDALREQIGEWLDVMENSFPATAKEFKDWAKGRNFGRLSEITSPALRGIHRKAKSMLDAAVEADEKPTVKDSAQS